MKVTVIQEFELEKLEKRGFRFKAVGRVGAYKIKLLTVVADELRVLTASTEAMVKEEFGSVEVVVIDPQELYPGDTVYLWGEKSGRDFWLEMEVLPS